MAVQSIKRVFTSFRTIAQYLAESGTIGPPCDIYLHKIIVLRLGLIIEQVFICLPTDDCISIEPSLSLFPQKLISIACLHLQQLWEICEQIQKSQTKKIHLCLVDEVGTATHYWHNFSHVVNYYDNTYERI